jgi:Tfp pilus assembly protein PilN
MISTNLSTRPFYNERLVHTVLVIVGVLVLGVTALNVWTIATLSDKDARQNVQAAGAEKKTDEARQKADRIRRSIDATELKTVTTAAAEANQLIDERTFSWTQLLSDFERTLPSEVRITTVTPRVDRDGRMFIDVIVVARRAEDVNEFVEKLEAQGGFSDVVPRQENLNNEGLLEITLVGRYAGHARRTKP